MNSSQKKHIVVLSGAGISAESGIKTFRDADGLWEGHDIMEVASPLGFKKNPELVLEFYNKRRKQLLLVKPNKAHYDLAHLETSYKVSIITQNVDDLHERAGSTNILHLHGELLKVRSTKNENYCIPWTTNLNLNHKDPHGYQLRPNIVWFGEPVPLIDKAMTICSDADYVIIIGTSLQVYPAANLIGFFPKHVPIYYIDPNNPSITLSKSIISINEPATIGVSRVINMLNH